MSVFIGNGEQPNMDRGSGTGGSGYIDLPSGLQIRWGYTDSISTPGAEAQSTVTFAKAFSNACVYMTATNWWNTSTGLVTGAQAVSASQGKVFAYRNGGAINNYQAKYIAFGY